MLFPRMYSDAPGHPQAYEDWLGGVEGTQVPYDQCGQMMMVKVPTQWENIKFFFSYQVNFMYWRYFMWNFAGRQNDIQGQGEIEHGNWITGIPVIDKFLVGDQSLLPSDLKNNKGHNVFYCLPLLLGLIGLFWQAYKVRRITTPDGKIIYEPIGIQQFWIVFFLFFMTGLAIVLYLNQTPLQPRERDYAYAGSFYAFAIWIGMGVAGISEWLQKKIGEKPASVLATVVCLLVPIQMVSQTWDDHDRSNRYVARDFGQNYLSTVQEEGNPIIFTNGDNDTFPLWYNQETEGFRTDVRVCNLSYLQTDWYIDQMKRQAYDSPAVPIDWSRLEYVQGHNEAVAIRPEVMESIKNFYKQNPEDAVREFGENPYELKNILKYWVRSPKEGLQMIPTDSIVIKLDKEAIKRSGMMIPDSLHGEIPEYMNISLKGKRMLYKSELMMLEMLANTNWDYPNRRVRACMAITDVDDNNEATGLVLYMPDRNISVQRRLGYWWRVDDEQPTIDNECSVFRLAYKATEVKPFGRSRISRDAMAIIDGANRTIVRAEANAEFYAFPKILLTGTSEELASLGTDDALKLYMGRYNMISKDIDGQSPTVTQLAASSMDPHLTMLKSWAAMFASAMNIPASSLGIVSDANPTSADATEAQREDLIIEARHCDRDFGESILQAARLVARMQDPSVPDEELMKLQVDWKNPNTPSSSMSADAFSKLAGSIDSFANSEVGMTRAGLSRSEIVRLKADQRKAQAGQVLDQIRGMRQQTEQQTDTAAREGGMNEPEQSEPAAGTTQKA